MTESDDERAADEQLQQHHQPTDDARFTALEQTNQQLSQQLKQLLEIVKQQQGVKVYTSHKMQLPRLSEEMTYSAFKHSVEIWQLSTEVQPEKQALILLNEMPDRDIHGGLKRIIPERAMLTKLKTKEGVKHLLKVMEDIMQDPDFVRLVDWLHDFSTLKQDKTTMYERFIAKCRELKRVASEEFGFEIPSKIMAAKILSACNTYNPQTIGVITQGISLMENDNEDGGETVEDKVINSCRKFVATLSTMDMNMNVHEATTDNSSADPEEIRVTKRPGKVTSSSSYGYYTSSSKGKGKETANDRFERCKANGLCYECESSDHKGHECPERVRRLKWELKQHRDKLGQYQEYDQQHDNIG